MQHARILRSLLSIDDLITRVRIYSPRILYLSTNPPIITSHPPPNMLIHALTPHHAHAHRVVQSISDLMPIGARSAEMAHLFEDFSRTLNPNTARARAKKSAKKEVTQRQVASQAVGLCRWH